MERIFAIKTIADSQLAPRQAATGKLCMPVRGRGIFKLRLALYVLID